MQDENMKTEFHKTVARFLELFIWIFITALIITSIVLYNSYSHTHFNRYQIFFQDVDGIIEGSPVKMLGIQVGYVKHIKFVNDMVYVDLIITEKDMEIPKGSKITVEFNGLGGSKSLEIYPPEYPVTQETAALVIQQPRRLGDALHLLNAMLEKIGHITFRCTTFANQLDSQTKDIKPKFGGKNQDFLNNADKWLDKKLEDNNRK